MNKVSSSITPLNRTQQKAVDRLYALLEPQEKGPSRQQILDAWKQLNKNTKSPIQRAILYQLHAALVNLRRDQLLDILSILGSWGDTMDDEDIHRFLRELNGGRPLLEPIR